MKCPFGKTTLEKKYDTAGKGSSALLAGCKRSLFAEIGAHMEEEVIAVFNDFEKRIDTIDIVMLIFECINPNH